LESGEARWEVQLTDENGKRAKRRFRSEREARAALDSARARRSGGLAVLPVHHTMGDLFTAWLDLFHQQVERGERSSGSLRQYEPAVAHMRPVLGGIDCRKLSVKQIEDYLAALPLSAQTRSHHRAILRRVLNVGMKWGWVDQNVAVRTDPITVRQHELAALSLADAEALLDALKADRLYSAFVTALYTGLRAGELAGLRVEDIDLGAGVARVHQQVQPAAKGHGLADVPLKTHASASRLELIPAVVAVLTDAIGERSSGYVWESAPRRPYWPTSFTHAFTRALERAKLPHLRLHDLRHYFVSFLPQLDVHPAVAQKLARHASIGTTMNRYTSVEESLKKQAMGRLHEAIFNPVAPSVAPSAVPSLRIVG